MMRFNLLTGCLLSLGAHAGAFFLLPGLAFDVPIQAALPTDAELVELDVPLPPALQPPPMSPQPALDKPTRSASVEGTYDTTRIVPPDMQKIEGTIEKMSPGVSVQLPSLALQLPTHSTLEETPLPKLTPPPELSTRTAAMLEQSLQPPGLTTGVDKQIGWGQVRLGDKQSPSRLGLPQLDQRLVARTLPTQPPVPALPPTQPLFGIQGPAAKREPLYRPPLPKVQVQVESDITLRFWVRPDGVVSRVFPERKGEAALEAAAIRYLEGWRFTPLPAHEPQVEQWGTITMRFLLPEP
jgi:TonB family protein